LGLRGARPPATAIGAGIVAGIAVVVIAAALGAPTIAGLNVGLFGLIVNVAIAFTVSAMSRS